VGLFKFIKDAGAKLFGGGGAQAATPDALKQTVESHGFDPSKLNIDVQGDRVKLSGQAMIPTALIFDRRSPIRVFRSRL
jgi:hypothetical protein